MQALLMHVGADSSNYYTVGRNAPIFNDRTFEFVPIVEKCSNSPSSEYITREDRTFSKLLTFDPSHGRTLAEYVPEHHWNSIVHFDPDLTNMTYGEPSSSIRGKQIFQLEKDDLLLFVSSLALENSELKSKQKLAKYIVAYFTVQNVFHIIKNGSLTFAFPVERHNGHGDNVLENLGRNLKGRIEANAHLKRNSDDAIIVVGKIEESSRLEHAIRITQFGWPFAPSMQGKRLYGMASYPRGFKWIEDNRRLSYLEELLRRP